MQMLSSSLWTTRLALARSGWMTEIRLDRSGLGADPGARIACGAWARRHDWKGWVADVVLHAHAIVDLKAEDIAEGMSRTFVRLQDACIRAEAEFVETIPCMTTRLGPEGKLELAENRWELDQVRNTARDVFPSEALPEDVRPYGAEGEIHLEALCRLAQLGLHVEDSLNPYFGPARLIRDCKNREWGYRLRIAVREAEGRRIRFQPQEISTRILHEEVVASITENAGAALTGLFAGTADAPRSGTDSGTALPPGFAFLMPAS